MAQIDETPPNRSGAVLAVIGVAVAIVVLLLCLASMLIGYLFQTQMAGRSIPDANIVAIDSTVETVEVTESVAEIPEVETTEPEIAQPEEPPTEQAPPTSVTVNIAADQKWQSTEIVLTIGQSFEVTVLGGEWIDAAIVVPSAAGSGYICNEASCCEPMPYAQRDALIGRIGESGEAFLVGIGGHFTASGDGALALRMNDCDDGLFDNSGNLEISISVLD